MVPVNGSLTVTIGNGRIKNMEKTFKVVVLDDGETWAGEADIVILTQKGYDDLMNGVKYDQLDDKDVLDVKPV